MRANVSWTDWIIRWRWESLEIKISRQVSLWDESLQYFYIPSLYLPHASGRRKDNNLSRLICLKVYKEYSFTSFLIFYVNFEYTPKYLTNLLSKNPFNLAQKLLL